MRVPGVKEAQLIQGIAVFASGYRVDDSVLQVSRADQPMVLGTRAYLLNASAGLLRVIQRMGLLQMRILEKLHLKEFENVTRQESPPL